MATGDSDDMLGRLKSLIPYRWFANVAPIRDAVLGGVADSLAWCYSYVDYARLQTRLKTATGVWLDIAALDFLGLRFRRKKGQADASFSIALRKEIFRERATRPGMYAAVHDLTQTYVKIFEAFNPQDTGGFGAQWALSEDASAWGSTNYPWTMFITAQVPLGAGIPYLSGLNDAPSGFLGASAPDPWAPQFSPEFGGSVYTIGGDFALADITKVTGLVTNQDIYDTINATRAAGITCWVNIGPPPITGGRLDMTFYLDTTPLA